MNFLEKDSLARTSSLITDHRTEEKTVGLLQLLFPEFLVLLAFAAFIVGAWLGL